MAVVHNKASGTLSMSAALDAYTDPLYVLSWRWEGDAITTGDDLVVVDPVNAETIIESVSPGDDYVEEALVRRWWHNGAKVATMTHGTFFIRYK